MIILAVGAFCALELTGIINLFEKVETTESIKGKIPVRATAKDEYGVTYIIELDEKGNQTYSENESGFWEKWEYNENGRVTYQATSHGDFRRITYEYE